MVAVKVTRMVAVVFDRKNTMSIEKVTAVSVVLLLVAVAVAEHGTRNMDRTKGKKQ